MAAPGTPVSNAYQRVDIEHSLEDIHDAIYDVSRTDRPVLSNGMSFTATNVLHEFTMDKLDAAADPGVAPNAWKDGVQFAPETITAPMRRSCVLQMFEKHFAITRRNQLVAKAGPDNEVARQVVRKGQEDLNDIERHIAYNIGSVQDTDGDTAPITGGFPSWLTSNAQVSATGGSLGGWSSGNTTAYTPGTPEAAVEQDLLDLIESTYKNSNEGLPLMVLDSKLKQKFTGYMFASSAARVGGQIQERGGGSVGLSSITVIGAVGAWQTDFGIMEIQPSPFMPEATEILMLNPDYYGVAYLTRLSTDAMGQRADTRDRMIIADCGLAVTNEAAHAFRGSINLATSFPIT